MSDTNVDELIELTSGIEGTYIGIGTDTFPTPNGPQITKYRETMTVSPWAVVNNPGPNGGQTLTFLQYATALVNATTGAPMHQECGFWMFQANGTFQKAIAIPRGISILAGGLWTNTPASLVANATAQAGSATYGISNEPYLNTAAPTTKFTNSITSTGTSIAYNEDSVLHIEGQDFNHTDQATLYRQ